MTSSKTSSNISASRKRRSERWEAYKSFVASELMIDQALATPLRFIWNAYRANCERWGFPSVTVETFVKWISDEEEIRIVRRGNGRIRAMAIGVAVRKETQEGSSSNKG